jgi:hypothetical protein
MLVRRQRNALSLHCTDLQSQQLCPKRSRAIVAVRPGKAYEDRGQIPRHRRYVIFQLVEAPAQKDLFQDRLRSRPAPAYGCRTRYHYKMRVFVNDEEKTQLGDQTSCGTTETRLAAQPTGDFRKPSPATVFAILEVIGRMSGVTAAASWSKAGASSICAEG